MQDASVLVTGGAGFIGSNLANHLAAGNDVIALDDLYLGDPDNLDPAVEFVDGSVLEEDLGIGDRDVDVCFHLAALSSRQMLASEPRRGARVNVEGFVNVVEQLPECETVVYASTSSVYDDDPPGRETDPVTADTGYEASMLARERYAEHYNADTETSLAGMRFFSVYQGYGGAEEHKGEYANTVSQWAAKMARGERPVLWGDGEQTRDYVHVDDVVAALEQVADERLSGVYNVGTGKSYSFNRTVELLNEALGTDITPEYRPVPLAHYNYRQQADASRLRSATGWTPTVDFETGVRQVCAPYLETED